MMFRFFLCFLFISATVVGYSQAQSRIELRHLSTYNTGLFAGGAAEISAYDEVSKRLFFVNATDNSIDVLDLSDPNDPVFLFAIDIDSFGGGANSVVAWNGYFAIAVEANVKQDPGMVIIFDSNGGEIAQLEVGSLPDMIGLSPDRTMLVTANEGEPNDAYTNDPEGSVSIIRLPVVLANVSQADVQTISFSDYNFIRKSFETNDNWLVSFQPSLYTEGASSWSIVSSVAGLSNTHGQKVFAGSDIHLSSYGVDQWHTMDFEPRDVSGMPRASIEFNYAARNWTAQDSIGYIIERDNGTSWNMINYVSLSGTTGWNHIRVELDDLTQPVRLRLMVKQQNTGGNFAFDDVRISFIDQSTRVFGNNGLSSVTQDFEPEYVAFDASSETAWIGLQENNAMVKLNLTNGNIIDIKGLGFKDHNLAGQGLDASDQDNAINIANYPIKGMYMPDAIYGTSIEGSQYIVSANEGDARAYAAFNEEVRVSSRNLDPTAYPNAPALKNNANAGRLRVTSALGDVDFDGDYDQLYSYGARSFSIWNENGELVFDSGDDFEQIVAQNYPLQFNSNNDDNTSLDSRSDDKGPEPEAVTIGKIYGYTYAFIGLEREGGIMVYDISNPQSPLFLQYINNRNFAATETSSASGDLGPEGILFIPREKSPNERDLIVLSSEISGTVSVFQVDINLNFDEAWESETAVLSGSQEIATFEGQSIFEGGFSGLHALPNEPNKFLTISDRGPNVDASSNALANGNTLFFPNPEFVPTIYTIEKIDDQIQIIDRKPILNPSGSEISGLPLPIAQGGTGEIAWSDLNGAVHSPNSWGIDSEGIVLGNDGNYWVCDEYGSSIWKIDPNTGTVINRYTPFPVELADVAIDEAVGTRRPNRGFEGLCWAPNGKVYAVLQSPADNPTTTVGSSSRIHRIIELDPLTEEMKYYAYVHKSAIGEIRERDWKIGDLTAINDHEFLLIEHAERNDWSFKNIIKIDIANATPFEDQTFGQFTLEELITADALIANEIIPVEKELLVDLLEVGWNVENDKPEGLTIIDSQTIALVNDNDFGITSQQADGSIQFTGKESELFIIHLPDSLSLNVLSPYCQIDLSIGDAQCAGVGVPVSVSGDITMVEWSTGDDQLNFETLADGEIWVRAVTSSGCVASASGEIARLESPVISLETNEFYCSNDSLVVELPIEYSYLWMDGSTAASRVLDFSSLPVGPNEISLEVTNLSTLCLSVVTNSFDIVSNPVLAIAQSTPLCENGISELTVTGDAIEFIWSTDETASNIGVTQAGIYEVTGSNSFGCSTESSILVSVSVLPQSTLSSEYEFCSNDVLVIEELGSSDLVWSDGSTTSELEIDQSGNYYVDLFNEDGCVKRHEFVVTELIAPNLQLPEDQILCNNDTIEINLMDYDAVLWSDGYSNPIRLIGDVGEYEVHVSFLNGCSATEFLILSPTSVPPVDLGADRILCFGESTVFAIDGFISYLWSTDEVTNQIEVGEAATIAVTVMDENQCMSSDEVEVSFYDEIIIPLESTIELCKGGSVILDAGDFDSVEWSNGATSQLLMIDQPVSLTLTVFDGNCSSTLSIEVIEVICQNVEDMNAEEIQIYPNPSSDWVWIKSKNIISQIVVFDAIGNIIQSLNPNQSNAALSLEELPYGNYFVRIETDNTQYIKKIVCMH